MTPPKEEKKALITDPKEWRSMDCQKIQNNPLKKYLKEV